MKLSIEDRVEIEDLYARYGYGFDEGDGAAWAAVFTPDGSFLRDGEPDLVGSEALSSFVEERAASAPHVTHHTTNILIEGTPGGARGKAYVIALRMDGGTMRLRNLGRYDAAFVLEPQAGE
jgi:uncharacterized protein (TIGR02246 family)